MSNTTTDPATNPPASTTTPTPAMIAAQAYVKERKAKAPIPKPVLSTTPEQDAKRNSSRLKCAMRIQTLNLDPQAESLMLDIVDNNYLDNESRESITDEVVEAKRRLDEKPAEFVRSLNIVSAKDLIMKNIVRPPELIKGILYQGGKLSYNAPSKMGKTWSLLHLGISISEGQEWFGFQTTKSKVLFINPELQNFSFEGRVQVLAQKLNAVSGLENFDYVSTRGQQLSSSELIPLLEEKISAGRYGAIILDSIYKLYPNNTEENSSSDVGRFLSKLEGLANRTGAAIIYSHHYSKGNQAHKAAIDRSSGAGAWGRDPDSIISVTEHEKENAYSVEFNLRDFKPVQPITITVNWPSVFRDTSLNPKSLKTTQFPAKYTNADILKLLAVKPYTASELQKELKADAGMSSGTFYGLWADVKNISGVEVRDKKWSYIVPARGPALN